VQNIVPRETIGELLVVSHSTPFRKELISVEFGLLAHQCIVPITSSGPKQTRPKPIDKSELEQLESYLIRAGHRERETCQNNVHNQLLG